MRGYNKTRRRDCVNRSKTGVFTFQSARLARPLRCEFQTKRCNLATMKCNRLGKKHEGAIIRHRAAFILGNVKLLICASSPIDGSMDEVETVPAACPRWRRIFAMRSASADSADLCYRSWRRWKQCRVVILDANLQAIATVEATEVMPRMILMTITDLTNPSATSQCMATK